MAALRVRSWLVVLTCVFTLRTPVLNAQSSKDSTISSASVAASANSPLSKPTGCLANLPSTSLHRVPVFVSAWMMGHADTAFSLQADLMAQDVATELRLQLGGSDSAVTNEDGHLAWHSVPTSIVILAHRNGEMTAHPFIIGGDSTATTLVLRAFRSAREHGGAMMAWPDQFAKDSVYVRLDLWPNYIIGTSKQESSSFKGHRFPAFSLTEPEEDVAAPLPKQSPPRYPSRLGQRRFAGYVVMQLTVDTAGLAVPTSIRDLWPADKSRLEGGEGEAYDAFVSTLTTWLKTVRFRPAHLGSCLNFQTVEWPFEFKMARQAR